MSALPKPTAPAAAVDDPVFTAFTTHAHGFAPRFAQIAADAARRDTERDLPHEDAEALKRAGFARLRLPVHQGGAGVSLAELFAVARDLAYADPNLAHAFRNHFYAIEDALRRPHEPLHARLLAEAAQGRSFGLSFGDAPPVRAGDATGIVDGRLTWDSALEVYTGDGLKAYATGNLYADWLIGSAYESRGNRLVRYLVSTRAPGVDLRDDWAGFGQRLTGSGHTRFRAAHVEAADLYALPERPQHGGTWRFTFHQVYLTNVIAGIVRRIQADALALLRGRRRNFYHGQAESPTDEPVLQAQLGRIAAHAASVEALADRAVLAMEAAFAAWGTPQVDPLTLVATRRAIEAKIVIDALAPELASALIDLGSGSVVDTGAALDRHWRNIKVISAHNPRLYKERFLGEHLLHGALPPTGAFF